MRCLRTDSGFTLIETLVTMTLMIMIGAAFVLVFSTASKSIQRYRTGLFLTSEKLIKDDFVRTWAESVSCAYYLPSEPAIQEQASALKKHPYFEGKTVKFEYLKDRKKRIRGIEISYRLSNGSIQTSAALFSFIPVW